MGQANSPVAVTIVHASIRTSRPPILLVHGAANSSIVWRYWQQALAQLGWSSYAIDLRGHGKSSGSVDGATMWDYADDVVSVVNQLRETPVVMGWSMGGLVAMMVACKGMAQACVGLAPSVPVAKRKGGFWVRLGVFGPEEYGIVSLDAANQPTMPDLNSEERHIALESASQESRTARDERKAGIVLKSLPCPLLIVTGDEDRSWPKSAYENLHLTTEYLNSLGASHWGLVLNRRSLPNLSARVSGWLDFNL